jgi:hypothetical protein
VEAARGRPEATAHRRVRRGGGLEPALPPHALHGYNSLHLIPLLSPQVTSLSFTLVVARQTQRFILFLRF